MKGLKVFFIILRVLTTAAAAAAGIFVLYRFEYLTEINSLDNIVGVIPVAFVLMAVGAVAALIWLRYSKRTAPLAVCLAVLIALLSALFPTALRGSWWVAEIDNSVGSDGDISGYVPFKEDTLAVKLGEEPELFLDGDLPVMDGALALYPVYSAVAQAIYDESAYGGEVMFTNTVKAFDALIAGERDVIFLASASAKQRAAAEAAGVELVLTPIGREAFVFVAGKNNPVEGLTTRQIRNIYSGKTDKWATLGWREGGRIIAFQRPEGSGSQTGLQGIMNGLPIHAPRPLPSDDLIGTNSLMKQVSVEWKGVQPALGYTYRFFGNTMYPNPDAKFLKVDGAEPSVENIRNGSYPFTVNFYAITNGAPQGNTKKLIDWLLSEQGQRLIGKTGYVPL